MRVEYGIKVGTDPELHRGPMTREEAKKWIAEVEAAGAVPGAFYLVVRSVSDWRELH